MPPPTIARMLETSVYAEDLEAANEFYGTILGLERIAFIEGRHLFFRCGEGVLLIFDPRSTATVPTSVGGAPVPLHGATGAGHVALAIAVPTFQRGVHILESCGVAIESEVTWPRGWRSLYVRDPEGTAWSWRRRVCGDSRSRR